MTTAAVFPSSRGLVGDMYFSHDLASSYTTTVIFRLNPAQIAIFRVICQSVVRDQAPAPSMYSSTTAAVQHDGDGSDISTDSAFRSSRNMREVFYIQYNVPFSHRCIAPLWMRKKLLPSITTIFRCYFRRPAIFVVAIHTTPNFKTPPVKPQDPAERKLGGKKLGIFRSSVSRIPPSRVFHQKGFEGRDRSSSAFSPPRARPLS